MGTCMLSLTSVPMRDMNADQLTFDIEERTTAIATDQGHIRNQGILHHFDDPSGSQDKPTAALPATWMPSPQH